MIDLSKFKTNFSKKIISLSLLLCIGNILINPLKTYAQEINNNNNQKITIDYETPALNNRSITLDDITISINYTPFNYEEFNDEELNLTYDIYYQDTLQITGENSIIGWGEVSLQHFDNDNIPEIIITTYSGGAHCCTNHLVYTWQNDEFIPIDLGYRDGGGGIFEDIDNDGNIEFLTVDNSFLYRFSSYAGSVPPTMILTFNNASDEMYTCSAVSTTGASDGGPC